MKLIKSFIKDFERARENHEEYQRLQTFFKSEPETNAVIDFMHFDYLDARIVKVVLLVSRTINGFFTWWLDFHRLSFVTLIMFVALIYIMFK